MISRHEFFVNNMIRHFLYDADISLWLKFGTHTFREQKLSEDIFCKDLTKKVQFGNSRLGLELKNCLNMPYK